VCVKKYHRVSEPLFERKERCAFSSQAQSTFDINYAFGLHRVTKPFLHHHRLRIYTHQQRDSKLEKKNEHRSIRRSSDPLRFFVFGK
jgi:hypothetical protein